MPNGVEMLAATALAVPAALARFLSGNARPTALAPRASSWTLDPRVYEEPGQFTGCPDGQRNAAQSECLTAVQEAVHAMGETLEHHDLKEVDAGTDGWVPFGCSYSRGHGKRAMFNRNPAGRSTGSYPLVCIQDGAVPPTSDTAMPTTNVDAPEAEIQPDVYTCKDPTTSYVDGVLERAKAAGVRLHGLSALDPGNLGDMMSVPFLMFPQLQRIQATRASLYPTHLGTEYYKADADSKALIQKLRLVSSNSTDLIIIGGGGLLGLEDETTLQSGLTLDHDMREVCSMKADCVIWGIGSNLGAHEQGDVREYSEHEVLAKVDELVRGTTVRLAVFRDHFTPPVDKPWESFYDATAMLAGLDCKEAPTHERVYYHHAQYSFVVDGDDGKVPSMDNSEKSVPEVLRHLCSGASVVTSSYHGALWGMLLGRKVVVVNAHSSKFRTFRPPRPPVLVGQCPSNAAHAGAIDVANNSISLFGCDHAVIDKHELDEAIENSLAQEDLLLQQRKENCGFFLRVLKQIDSFTLASRARPPYVIRDGGS